MSDAALPPDASYDQLYVYAQDLRRLLVEREAAQAQLRAYVADLQTLLRERDAARGEADAAMRAKERFLACIGHELRTPLTTIIGFAEVLLHDETRPEATDYLQRIVTAGQTLAALTDRLLTTASLHRREFPAVQAPCLLQPLLQSLASEFEATAHNRGVTLTLELPAAAPSPLQLDAPKFAMALRAVLDNALKFPPGGTVCLRLVASAEGGTPAWVEVEDTGPGIAPAFGAQLFTLFTQADSSPARAYDGAGLGLSMAQALLQVCGCELMHLPPDATAGNRFRIVFPAKPLPAPAKLA